MSRSSSFFLKNVINKSFILLLIIISSFGFSQKKTLSELISKSQKSPDDIIRCGSTEYEKYLQEKYPNRATDSEFESWIAKKIEMNTLLQKSNKKAPILITIPVVVHVIYSGEDYGVAPNITDAQVESQITVMNQDFRKMTGTPGFNNNPVGADVEIQFVLAKVDPNGSPTTGINRVSLCQRHWSEDEIEKNIKPSTIWDPTQYLNVWSIKFSNSTLLGYAQFPSKSGLPGLLEDGGVSETDGVVANFAAFGSSDYDDGTFFLGGAPFDKGRTMTHEVGHWLGLRHIWGDADCGNDYCNDTPTAHTQNYGCPTVLSCDNTNNEMVENYMDYTDDTCMNIVTLDQKTRIRTVLVNSPNRKTLSASTKGTAIALFPNDAEIILPEDCNTFCNATLSKKVILYNRGTRNLTSATIQYNLNNGTNYTYNWTGNVAPNKYEEFNMPVSVTGNGILKVSIVNVNGSADQRATNNTSSISFTSVIPAIPTFNSTTVNFKLQRDMYGSDTTWKLSDCTGTILYEGGPYKDTPPDESTLLPDLINKTWDLALDQVYFFSIKDVYGDGICCEAGEGFYELSTSTGTIMTNSTFEKLPYESFTFKLSATAGVEDINRTKNNISIYPNPNKGSFFVKLNTESGNVNTNIYDSTGKLLYNETFNHTGGLLHKEFNINLPKGTYILNLKTINSLITEKIIIK